MSFSYATEVKLNYYPNLKKKNVYTLLLGKSNLF